MIVSLQMDHRFVSRSETEIILLRKLTNEIQALLMKNKIRKGRKI